jgi:hypothetical protein
VDFESSLKNQSMIVPDSQLVIFTTGWSIVSTFIDPDQSSMDSIFASIIQNISIVKNDDGLVFWPTYNVNQIGNHMIGEGYQIKTLQADTLIVFGSRINPQTTSVFISQGWNIIAYFLDYQKSIELALNPILVNVIMVKSGNGLIFWPQYGVNNIVNMQEGQGYHIKMTLADTLFYWINTPPSAIDDYQVMNEDETAIVNVTGNDVDAEGNIDPGSVETTGLQQPSHGDVTFIDPVTGEMTYVPNANYSGPDQFEYRVTDSLGLSDTAIVFMSIQNVNDAPIANNDFATVLYNSTTSIPITTNDTDIDGSIVPNLTEITQAPVFGTAIPDGNGNVDYTTPSGFSGVDSLECVIWDDGNPSLSDTSMLYITVEPQINNPPTANNDQATTPYQTAVTINLLLNDYDSDGNLVPNSVTITQAPSNGAITNINPTTGEATYLPNNGFTGTDNFQYSVSDNGNPIETDSADVSVNVQNPTNTQVTFIFKSASEDTTLINGTSTLHHKKNGLSSYSTLTSANGTITVTMDPGSTYEIYGSHSGDIESFYGVASFYTFLKRPGQLEAFEQRAVDDQSSPVIIQTNDTIFVYNLMNDFPLTNMMSYASYTSMGNTGTRKFSTADANATAWWDVALGDSITATQQLWFDELKADLTSIPHCYLTMPFEESSTEPTTPHLWMQKKLGNPSPGVNSTIYNPQTHEITEARARWPPGMTEGTFKIEVTQALHNLNDVGGVDPAVLNPGTYTLNTTGRKILSVLYLAQAKTKF